MNQVMQCITWGGRWAWEMSRGTFLSSSGFLWAGIFLPL